MYKALIFVAILATSCTDIAYQSPDPMDASRIAGGVWVRQDKNGATWRYWFNAGYCLTTVSAYGIQVERREYQYQTEADKIMLVDFVTGKAGEWEILFASDTLAAVTVISPTVGVDFEIHRR